LIKKIINLLTYKTRSRYEFISLFILQTPQSIYYNITFLEIVGTVSNDTNQLICRDTCPGQPYYA